MGGVTGKVRLIAAVVRTPDYTLTLTCASVVPDGYGLSYSIGDDYIRWTITSLKRRTQEFKQALLDAALETRDMMERAAKAEASKPKL